MALEDSEQPVDRLDLYVSLSIYFHLSTLPSAGRTATWSEKNSQRRLCLLLGLSML